MQAVPRTPEDLLLHGAWHAARGEHAAVERSLSRLGVGYGRVAPLCGGGAVAAAGARVCKVVLHGQVEALDHGAAALDLAGEGVVAVLDAALWELCKGAWLPTKLGGGHLAVASVWCICRQAAGVGHRHLAQAPVVWRCRYWRKMIARTPVSADSMWLM